MGDNSTVLVLPKFLFRYRSLSHDYSWPELSESILRSRFYLALASFVNDPFDVNPVYSPNSPGEMNKFIIATKSARRLDRTWAERASGRQVSRQDFRKSLKKPQSKIDFAKLEIAVTEKFFEALPQRTRLACFSERVDCLPMWAHYANNQQGVCVKYSFDLDILNLKKQIVPMAVSYRSDRPIITTIDIKKFSNQNNRIDDLSGDKIFESLYLRKSIDWSYEKEWRCFENSEAQGGYVEIPCLKATELIFGVRAKPEDIERAKKLFSHKLKIKIARLSKSEYNFDFEDIN